MVRLTLEVPKLSALVANFYATDAEIQEGARAIVANAAEVLDEYWAALCPVDTGLMKSLRRVQFTESGLEFNAGWLDEDFAEAQKPFYPPFVEFGTRFMRAQPSLGPAFEQTAPLFEADMRDLIEAAAARKAGRARRAPRGGVRLSGTAR